MTGEWRIRRGEWMRDALGGDSDERVRREVERGGGCGFNGGE